ncbi:uncharacterized protein LOC117571684 isoform X2 [Drosophila albomicans]|uniref:Uncharacterized protein LOC117571684 isoform X2 n=1 Tax=Drosophila albomicans TaxID=7291 RepID=A0A6P8X139_DROAB|nr:uncharacterized protein LOC117571684 isoform X2 [Drosophila albomicans]
MKANESRVHILQLNDYCLENILKYLEMEDHLSFAETCHYFRDVFNRWASSFYYIHIVLMAEISKHDFKLLSLVYKNVKTLCVDVDDLMHSLNKHYGNERKYYFRQFCKLIIGMQQLQSLKLWEFNCKKRQYAQNIIKMAGSLHQLQQLEIFAHKCGNISRVLRPFKQLEILTLDVNLSSKELRRSCHSMPHLRQLSLTSRVDSSTLKDVIKDSPQLEELSFYLKPKAKTLYCFQKPKACSSEILQSLAYSHVSLVSLDIRHIISDLNEAKLLATISSLKILTCRFSNADCVHWLRQLSLLEELRISLLETIVDMTEIYLDLIGTCTRLRFLRIFDLHICENFAIQVSKVLEECVHRRPLELIIYGDRDSTIMRTSKDIDSSHLIYSRMNARELIKCFNTHL